MNLLELGALLRRERESRRLSVRDVMDATKISRRNLNALEEGEVKLLPHPVYLKGYIRNYARLVGLEYEPLVAVVDQQSDGDAGYLPQAAPVRPPEPSSPPVAEPAHTEISEPVQPVLQADPAPQPEPVAEPSESFVSQLRFPEAEGYSSRPRKRLWPWVLLLLFAAIMGILYLQYQRIQAELEREKPPVAEAPVLADNATNATLEANATVVEANATLPEPAPAPEPAPVAPAPVAPAPVPPAAKPSAPAAVQAVPAKPAAPTVSATPSVSTAPIEVTRKATPAAEPRTPGMQELLISAKPGETCWVEVSEGAQRKSFTLRDGDSRRFEFSSKAKVRLGNAGGVSFQLNGAFYPYDGERGQTATVEIGAR